MHHYTITLKSPPFPPYPHPHRGYAPILNSSVQNPNAISNSIFTPSRRRHRPVNSVFICGSTDISIANYPRNSSSSSSSNGSLHEQSKRTALKKPIDVATLGNLCVDIVLNVPDLPPSSLDDRKAYMNRISASPPDKQFWEAGGNCNMAIAAARLGLDCVAVGHVGNEIYGKFLLNVLNEEGINVVGMFEETDIAEASASYETLLCWVLVDPLQRHGFCSRLDFREEPAFDWICRLSDEVKMAIRRSKILFCNGYDFDELSPGLIVSTLEYAAEVGTAVFFDPGPRGKSLKTGTAEEQRALAHFLSMSDVLVLTSDEAESLTGIDNPIQAGQELLRKGLRTKWVIVKMGAQGSILVTVSSISVAPAFKVNVIDTVGCGDSFVAAIAFGFIHNIPLVSTLAIANAVGAATAMGYGAGRNVASLERVIELVRESNLNENDKFWEELLQESPDVKKIRLLSRCVVNGNNNQLKRVALQEVVPELLPRLESLRMKRKVPT